MPVSTVSAAAYIGPTAVKTFFKHSKKKLKRKEKEDAQDSVFFDEAFHIVKSFIEFGTLNTVESLQSFTNTHVPSPYWAVVAPVSIPLTTCNASADYLIDWFGPEELKSVVGGERWWQVRGLQGVDAEWITQKHLLPDTKDDDTLDEATNDIRRMDSLERVMLYVHGGGYFWGSINTHRYQLIRYARKIEGRVFAVNYRKAPQYPWPCPLQDVLAAYLYLIRPPPNAPHKPVSPSKIVLAGDSAGGGLCLSMLSVLRDMDIPLPSGAVLISPWVDLTHSLPSVMNNTKSDIIPEHGFLAKPSALWPIDLVGEGRVTSTKSNPPPEPGHADQLRPTVARVQEEAEDRSEPSTPPDTTKADADEYDIDYWEPRPPKVQMADSKAVPLELHSQIQLYATNEQLTHPLVSPILQGSLANLPPLYILAGDGEVLRDEIVYIAHRASHPEKFPTRKGTLRDAHRQQENAGRYTEPTKVHLELYDDMCHVLTVFTFTESAKHAYRSIGAFVKHVTNAESTPSNPFPHFTDLTDPSRMIRQRVDIKGELRAMEPMEEMDVLNIEPGQIGIIKEQPTVRWFKGQQQWDKKYKRTAEKAMKKRQRNLEKAEKIIAHAKEQGLQHVSDSGVATTPDSASLHETGGVIERERRWGPLDLDDERPPPSAIAKRLDTPEALALLKKHIYHTAPATHRTIPKLKLSDAVKAALDPNDDPNKPPKQSVAEAQVRNNIGLNGMRVWDVLLGYFMRKSTETAENGKEAVKNAVNA
ncbi:AB hydrolase superfamily protein C4A8.06c [Mycena indigotica]|uniref:AB hydrolase superfamily protein C4A8.06c n=1 Tax=Mycena indigotica TaxID=2126181 RepID=A0A8H6SNE8_9AGAR|nr:AB hydrolase superfamily protein C4A8.06c [Mycena indigotica]KAF7301841.1 AB hydrolase superfamily protein C4A8.06c [Mycena indigotica]